jgi:hypothetical protein
MCAGKTVWIRHLLARAPAALDRAIICPAPDLIRRSRALSTGHLCRKAGGVNAQIDKRMYNDRHSYGADDQYKHFRIHLEIPV